MTKRRKRRLLGQTTQWVHRACYPNHVWSYDFVFDQTEDRRTLKCLTVVDEFTRQGLDIRLGRSITASDVIRILDELFQLHGRPVCLGSDNGPELVSHAVRKWLKDKHVGTHYIDPGSPWQNALQRKFQLDVSNHLSGPMAVQFSDRSAYRHSTMAGGIQHHQATWLIGQHEPGEILTVLDRRKFDSTTEIPNGMSGPKILGWTPSFYVLRVS